MRAGTEGWAAATLQCIPHTVEVKALEQSEGEKDGKLGERAAIRINLSILQRMVRRSSGAPLGEMEPFVKTGQTAADLGCKTGYYTFALAECVGPEGRIYAVDLNREAIRTLEARVSERGCRNIEPHATTAADLPFIRDGSVDFVLANGLLCTMSKGRDSAVKEIRRILRPEGLAYLSLGFPPPLGHVDRAEWEGILQGFRVKRRGRTLRTKWALVSTK